MAGPDNADRGKAERDPLIAGNPPENERGHDFPGSCPGKNQLVERHVKTLKSVGECHHGAYQLFQFTGGEHNMTDGIIRDRSHFYARMSRPRFKVFGKASHRDVVSRINMGMQMRDVDAGAVEFIDNSEERPLALRPDKILR